MIADRINATLRAIPNRRLSSGASGAIAPKHRTGIVSSNPAAAPDRRRPELIWCTSGPMLVATGRMLAATSTTPAISRADGAPETAGGRALPRSGADGVARVGVRAGNSVTRAS